MIRFVLLIATVLRRHENLGHGDSRSTGSYVDG